MSGTLDLNGGTVTIGVDVVETYYKVTDSGAGKDGTLVIEAGAQLLFDDADNGDGGPGFDPEWVGTFTINGTADNRAKIGSADANPHHPFKMALGVSGTWTQCRISGNGAFSSTGAIIPNNIVWGYDTYCSVDDVRRLTGISDSQVPDADISEHIAMAVDEIEDFTGRKWQTGSALNEDHDYGGEGFMMTEHYPVQSVTSLSFRSGGSFAARTEGPEADFYASPEDLRRGIIRFTTEPAAEKQAIRITYVFGEPSMSGRIRKLCAATAGYMALLSTTTPQKASTVDSRIRMLDEIVKRLKGQLGAPIDPWVGGNSEAYEYPRAMVRRAREI